MSDYALRVLSLGAGIQSTTMQLMIFDGEMEAPDLSIFADTGWEPKAVYDQLAYLEMRAHEVGYRIYRVSKGNLRDHIVAGTQGASVRSIPLFVRNGNGDEGRLRRNCTSDYKIAPIQRRIRELLGIRPRQAVPDGVRVEQWIGISLDEVYRMKANQERWIDNRYPLIERRMSRWDCVLWLRERGYPIPPKSSCIGCPYHSNAYWREMRDTRPDEWADAVDFDATIRNGLHGVKYPAYLHRSLKPLDQVDLSTIRDHGQMSFDDFTEECEGMCGV